MIDIHTHLLPGVDDGATSIAESLPVLRRCADEGVETVVCTPHLAASRVADAPHARHAEILAELIAGAPPAPSLVLGWEIMLDVPGADLRDPRLGLGGSTARLVEFSHRALPPHSTDELMRLRMSGVVPVVAHPERYRECTPSLVQAWRDAGALIQMDVTAIASARGVSGFTEVLLAEGMVDVFASDTHADKRSLKTARDWLTAVASPDVARLMTRENARRLLASEPTDAVPPITIKRGALDHLRELVFGRA